ncbi:hypothetical protein EJ02DRAFT_509169 [Clathrospora elynae]|uniref:Serine/threonine-protein kinase ppk6 n=1 Tax=Clathrospora elynae TaxID=706981 RepID=A0A6A5T176_9PLEO|nr:hypothetical protein EJ02DRAFT_509169 [Clathrospora elynae]
MSADLFAEFGADPPPNQQQKPALSGKARVPTASNFGFFNDLNTPALAAPSRQLPPQQHFQNFGSVQRQAAAPEDNDDWGDFEGGSSVVPAPAAKQDLFAFASPQASQPSSNAWNINSTAQDPFAFGLQPLSQPIEHTWQRASIVKAKKSADPSVLFDAEDDFDDDDDFGDFEGTQETRVTATATVASSSALVDLLGDMSVSQSQPPITSGRNEAAANRALKNPTAAKKSLTAGFGTMHKPKQTSATLAPTAQKENDGWDTFDDWEASIPTKIPTKMFSKPEAIQTAPTNTSAAPAPILSPNTDDPPPGELPPTNVPPPGVLLSLFPTLFAEAQEKLFKPMAAQALPMRNKLLAEPATIAYLQGYLILANVAAHTIAGRKLRWKRDQHLSQGMRIGPASSRATSGMKLTGIDKGESMKEEREVSDVVRHWKEQVGRLRHVVSGANQTRAGTLGSVPDLQETMPVKALKQSEGGIPARQPCMLCGLKRDERVTAADMATDDSFGEWWIDQVNMHRGCRNFWNEHKDTLRQR